MNDLEQKQFEQEEFETQYMRDLLEYWNSYSYALITEIYTGVSINLGMEPDKAYRLAKNNPNKLEKAKFFSSVFDKFKNVFKYKVPKFRWNKTKLYGKDKKPMTDKQWTSFNNYVSNYFKEHMLKVSENIGVKAYMLGRDTTDFKEKKKPYTKKSLFQVIDDQYPDGMPDTIIDAYKNYDFSNKEKQNNNKSLSNIAMYVTNTDNKLQEAIRAQIVNGIDNNLSPVEVASNLYWEVEKGDAFSGNNNYTAESLRKNWNRISSTEMASAYEEGIIAPYEDQAMESLKDPEKAQYFVRTGGSCSFCTPLQGSIVRLIPREIADSSIESLKDIGIKDNNTDVYIYSGKNNIGRPRADWQNCCPAHPHNKATFQPINLKSEWYNPKTKRIEHQQKKQKFIPKMKDFDYRSKEEKKTRKPHYIDSSRVQFNGNIYEAVSPDQYNKRLAESRKNPDLPIPVNNTSPSYRRIFEEAEKYGV